MHTLLSRKTRSRRPRGYNLLDLLEPRTLLSASLNFSGFNPDFFGGTSGAYVGSQLYVANSSIINGGEIDTVSTDSNDALVLNAAISVPDSLPASLVYDAANGKLYFADLNAGPNITEVDPAHPANPPVVYNIPGFTSPDFANPVNTAPHSLTVTTDGAVWFIPTNTVIHNIDNTDGQAVDVVGRLDPTTGTVSYLEINTVDSSVSNSALANISSHGNTVYISMGPIDLSADFGKSRIAVATFSSGAIQMTPTDIYTMHTGNMAADTYGVVSNVAVSSTGDVWFALRATATVGTPVPVADILVHGLTAQMPVTVPNAGSAPLAITNLSFDASGRLWFAEAEGNAVGFLDTTVANPDDGFTISLLPDGPGGPTTAPSSLIPDPSSGASTAWVIADNFDLNLGFTGGYSLLKVDVQSDTVPFSIAAGFTTSIQEDTLYTHVPLATFTAPAGVYQAVINWGDGSAPITVIAEGTGDPNLFVVYVTKSIANPGTYGGTIDIQTLLGVSLDTAPTDFVTTVTDTPLTVVNFSLTSLINKVATVGITFTDDITAKTNWFDATFSWGDGTIKKAHIIEVAPGVFMAIDTHPYKKPGTYTVTANITTSEVGAIIGYTTPPTLTVII